MLHLRVTPTEITPQEETYLSLVHFVTNDILIIAYFVQQQATIDNTRKRRFLWYFFCTCGNDLVHNIIQNQPGD
jgi:hypothetical protein